MTEPALFPEVVEEEARRQERHTSTMMKRAVPHAFAMLGTLCTGYLRFNIGPMSHWTSEARRMLLAGELDEVGAVRFLARALIVDTYGPEDAEDRLDEARDFLEHLARTL